MNLSILLKTPLFRSLQEAELERIFAELMVAETGFRKGEILAMQDEPCNRLIVLLSGSVTGEMSDASGKVAKIEDIEAPSPLAILFLFGAENRFPVQVTAREDGTAAIIPRQSVLRMLSMNETLLKNYLDISADFATRLSRKLNLMSLHTIRQKIAVYLLELSKRHRLAEAANSQPAGEARVVKPSDTVLLDKTKSALADYFGVARPSLERELTAMQRNGIIAADKKMITILDRRELIRLINN